MAGIFISYRRSDTMGWAGHLFADLCNHFGSDRVFMDIRGGIPRGADFEKTLDNALSRCEALLVLMGPEWLTCTRSDGSRRLDEAGDWVRNEAAAALQRDVLVVPVLFGGAPIPTEADLPDDLRPLCKRQVAEISDSRWNYDVGELIAELAKIVPAQQGDDVSSARSGLQVLQNLIAEVPEVAEAVTRTREVIENTYRQIDKLEAFKSIHDALHTIELECLRPLRASGQAARIRPFKIRFSAEMRRIQDCLQADRLNPVLQADVLESLELADEALKKAVSEPGEESFEKAVSELDLLLTGLQPRLDAGIADAAAELDLDRLVDLMTAVREKLPADSAEDARLEPFVKAIDALWRLREELGRQTREHTQLQRLDSKLRTVCVAEAAGSEISSEWSRIKRVRTGLKPPYSRPLEAASEDLTAIEEEIEAALAGSDSRSAMDLLGEYFRGVASVFRDVDTGLKDFCLRLSEVSRPLETVLKMV